jgi:hypothetical protein
MQNDQGGNSCDLQSARIHKPDFHVGRKHRFALTAVTLQQETRLVLAYDALDVAEKTCKARS